MEEKLRKALAAAEEASRAKSAFLANMSHEIRTPMNAVLGMTSLVLEADLSQEQRELLEMVDASGKKLVTLLNDILDLSRIEAGKLSLAREPFSLRKTLDQVLKPLALPARQKEKTGAPVCMPGKECRRILLAEDTPVNAIFAEKILTAAGHSVVRASSGQEALDALSGNGPFDLVLMDVQMPGMDGLTGGPGERR